MSQSTAAEAKPRSTSRGRTALAVIIFVIAGLLAPTAFVGAWASRTIDDTDRYVATVAPLLDSQEVRDAISEQVTTALFANLPVNELLAQTLPPKAAGLSDPIANGLKSFVRSQVDKALATPQAQQAWATVNAEVQSRLTAALKGDNSGSVTVQGDQIVLDTGVLFQKVKELLVAQGFTIFEKVPLPAAADRQFVLVQSDQIKTVSTVYRIVQPLANSLIIVVIALLIIGIFVSRNRRYGIFAAGWILLLTGAFIIGLLSVGRAAFLADLGVSDASWQAVTFDTVTRFLDGLGRTSLTLGLVCIIGGLIAGPSRAATVLRRGTLSLAARIGAAIASALPSVSSVGRVVKAGQSIIGVVIVALGVFFLVVGRTASAGRIIWIVVLALIAWFVVLVLASTSTGEASIDAAAPEAVEPPVDADV